MRARGSSGGSLEMNAAETITEEDRTPHPRELDETMRSWRLDPSYNRINEKKDSRKIFLWILGTIVATAFLAGIITLIVKYLPRHKHKNPPPDDYTISLKKALTFFNAQRSGKLPEDNNVTWRGNSCMKDGQESEGSFYKDLVGGYYDAGDAIKSSFRMSYAVTMLSWSVIEYSAKYENAGELKHVTEHIKWGTDYFLKTFNSSSDTIYNMVSQVGSGITVEGSEVPNDQYCWMRPEDIDYKRPVSFCNDTCSDLAAEMAAALASASIVFKDNTAYSKKLVNGAKTLYKFAEYSKPSEESSKFEGELLWGGTWLYFATGDKTYLERVTSPSMANSTDGNFSNGGYAHVYSWENKLPGAKLLLTRLRIFLSPPFPYETILNQFHDEIGRVMCSYLPYFNSFNRTKGGLIQLNHGNPQPLQYAANAAFLAALFSNYLDTSDAPGWQCGPTLYTPDDLRNFSKSQIDYILGKNPMNMSYVVDFGQRYPTHVHHRGASIPKNIKKESCTGGWKWRDSTNENPNKIVGAMVAGPDKYDRFHDVRTDYNYTEPTLAGNAGLVAALVALSGGKAVGRGGIDKNTIFHAIPSYFPNSPPPPAPWTPH